MTINDGYKFIYANNSSDEFNVMLCQIGSNTGNSTNDEKTKIITSKSPFKDTWDLHYVENTEELQFKIIICDKDGKYIDSFKQRELKRWLCKNDKRYWLQIDQVDLADVYYYCIISNPNPINASKYTIGLEFDVICDSSHAWSNLYKKTYETIGNTLNFEFNNIADFDDYILYPTAIITSYGNGNISIKNNTTGDSVIINNCKTNEVIIIDSKNDNIESNLNRMLLDDWNKNVVELIAGVNDITLTGNFTMKLEYRLPIRVGG